MLLIMLAEYAAKTVVDVDDGNAACARKVSMLVKIIAEDSSHIRAGWNGKSQERLLNRQRH